MVDIDLNLRRILIILYGRAQRHQGGGSFFLQAVSVSHALARAREGWRIAVHANSLSLQPTERAYTQLAPRSFLLRVAMAEIRQRRRNADISTRQDRRA